MLGVRKKPKAQVAAKAGRQANCERAALGER